MPNATRSPRKDASPSGTLLEELAREVFALRAELTSLREQLATEVRTRRLVVVDEDGFEGVTAEAVHQGGEVTAWCLAEEGERTVAVLFATADEQENAGVFVSGGGNIHGTFNVRRIGDLPNGSPSYGASWTSTRAQARREWCSTVTASTLSRCGCTARRRRGSRIRRSGG